MMCINEEKSLTLFSVRYFVMLIAVKYSMWCNNICFIKCTKTGQQGLLATGFNSCGCSIWLHSYITCSLEYTVTHTRSTVLKGLEAALTSHSFKISISFQFYSSRPVLSLSHVHTAAARWGIQSCVHLQDRSSKMDTSIRIQEGSQTYWRQGIAAGAYMSSA